MPEPTFEVYLCDAVGIGPHDQWADAQIAEYDPVAIFHDWDRLTAYLDEHPRTIWREATAEASEHVVCWACDKTLVTNSRKYLQETRRLHQLDTH